MSNAILPPERAVVKRKLEKCGKNRKNREKTAKNKKMWAVLAITNSVLAITNFTLALINFILAITNLIGYRQNATFCGSGKTNITAIIGNCQAKKSQENAIPANSRRE